MMYEVKIIDHQGVTVAHTIIVADGREDAAWELIAECESAISNESSWLDGLDEE